MSQKNCAKFFLSELRQVFTNFANFWQEDGKEAKIMRGALWRSSDKTVLHSFFRHGVQPIFVHLLWPPAMKQSGPILIAPEATRGWASSLFVWTKVIMSQNRRKTVFLKAANIFMALADDFWLYHTISSAHMADKFPWLLTCWCEIHCQTI